MKTGNSSGFFAYHSNNLKKLAEKAGKVLKKAKGSNPLQKTTIVIQTPGMGRWFSLQMAEIEGVCANLDTVFPEKFLFTIGEEVLKIEGNNTFFEKENLSWLIYDLLGTDLVKRKEFKNLREYVLEKPVKKYQLSQIVADLFDQYTVYRPEMIEKWHKNESYYKNDKDEFWQKELFREITAMPENSIDKQRFKKEFMEKCMNLKERPAGLPCPIVLFGISTMNKYQLDLFHALSSLTEIHLFFMNPCKEYWGEIVSRKTLGKMDDDNPFYYESPNLLLADLGFAGRVFLKNISEKADSIEDLFVEKHPENMLDHIKKNILEMDEGDFSVDNSIVVNGCWEKMREVEVLKDQLLNLFCEDNSLMPHDIAVLAPDIEDYAPYIEAVFNSGEHHIPWSISDRSAGRESSVAKVFLKILGLMGSMFKRSELFEVFEVDFVHKKFGVNKEDLNKIKSVLEESGIKWGIDKNWRNSIGFPRFEQNSWKFGLERILLGYAMPGKGVDMFYDVLPYDFVEGSESRTVAKFITFAEAVFSRYTIFKMEKTLEDWVDRLNDLISELFYESFDTSREIQYLRLTLDKLRECSKVSKFSGVVPLNVILAYLTNSLSSSGYGRGFISGQVTFCSFKPMRSIPFKVICMLGMNDESFPRDHRRPSFDLINRYPQINDRSHKQNDKYLFLETLVSAQSKVIVSYNPHNFKVSSQNSPALASLPVETLLETIEARTLKKNNKGKKPFVTLHPLQPFSREYFSAEEGIFTFSKKDENAAFALSDPGSKREKREKIERVDPPDPLNPEEKHFFEPEIDQFISFFLNPPKFFFKKRVGMTEPWIKEDVEDLEMFSFDNLSRYKVGEEYLDFLDRGFEPVDFKKKLRGEGKMPHGNVGRMLLDMEVDGLKDFAFKVNRYKGGSQSEKLNVETVVDTGEFSVRLHGTINSIYPGQLLFYRPSKRIRAVDKMKSWIYHLLMNASGVEKHTVYASTEKDIVFYPVKEKESIGILKKLSQIYFEGLSTIPAFTPSMLESLFVSHFKREFEPKDAFSLMLQSMDNPFSDLKADDFFVMAAKKTNFKDENSAMYKKLFELSDIIFKDIERYSEDR